MNICLIFELLPR